MSAFETIRLEKFDRVSVVTLNRPEVRNAFDPVMIRELTEAFMLLSAQTEASVIVLRGEGRSFCSGADLGYMKSMAGFSLSENIADSEQLFGLFWAMRSCLYPIVARLHGHVMGGALGLAAICDVTAAIDGTEFCFSEVRLGLAPAVISPFVLDKMHHAQARRYMLTAEMFTAADALDSGLIHFTGDEAQVDAFIAKVVEKLERNGPEALRATKALIRDVTATTDWSKRREITTRTIAERRVSEEGQEGLRSFLEKRTPKWRGHLT